MNAKAVRFDYHVGERPVYMKMGSAPLWMRGWMRAAGTVGQAVGNDGMERKMMVDARFGFKRLGTERNRLLGAAVYEQSGVGQDRGLKREWCEQAVRRPVRDPDLRFGPVRRE
jgi:hypothetical protein